METRVIGLRWLGVSKSYYCFTAALLQLYCCFTAGRRRKHVVQAWDGGESQNVLPHLQVLYWLYWLYCSYCTTATLLLLYTYCLQLRHYFTAVMAGASQNLFCSQTFLFKKNKELLYCCDGWASQKCLSHLQVKNVYHTCRFWKKKISITPAGQNVYHTLRTITP